MQNRYVRRLWGIGLFAMLLLCVQVSIFSGITVGTPAPTIAAEDDAAVAEEAPAEEGKEEGKEEASQKSETMLAWLYRSLGLRYVIIFLFLTFNLVAFVTMNLLAIRRDNIMPEALVQGFEAHLNEKRYQDAYDLAKGDESLLGKVLTAGMAQLSSGYDNAISAMEEVGAEENMRLEQRLSYVALIAQIGPMFGLLGTVDGMVMAFNKIAASSQTPKPSDLAQGIGTALVTTIVGLWIAIPSIAYYHIVRNRMVRLVSEVGVVSGGLMKRFATVGTGPKKS
jgi:biopolymer transport protein ExbB